MELRALGFSFKRATRRLARHEARLSRALEHQRLLIHEIHHRVKNNLQIVASLLNLQANRIRQPEAQNEFRQARDRVRTLATLHRHLYPETGSTAMRMPLFLKELCSQIAAAHGEDGSDRISVVVEAEDFEMSVDQAVPLALVTTEIVSNAIRYAFPDDRPGTVRLTLRQERAGEAVMVIEDDGIGLAVGERSHDRSQRTGLGLQLIRGFVRQLGGVMRCTSDPEADASVPPLAGTRYVITFPLTPPRGELRGHVVS
nr:sensor histidine kinase [Ameyamaea chiangmaiensis]